MKETRKLRTDTDALMGALLMNPVVLVIIIILVIILAVTGILFVTFATGTLLTIVFFGIGLYLIVKPNILAGMGPLGRFGIPLALIAMGLVFYMGWLKV